MNNIIRININEYLHIDVEIMDNDLVIMYTNCPENSISIIKDSEKVIIKFANKEIATYSFKDRKLLLTDVNVTTLEGKNFSEDVSSRGYNIAYKSNREAFESSSDEDLVEYPIELHTHFMEVLSGEQFLLFLSKYIKEIPINSSDIIVDCPIDKNNPTRIDTSKVYKWISIEEALKKPSIVEQLRVPTDQQVPFRTISAALAKRNSLIDLAGYYESKGEIETKASEERITKEKANDIKSGYKNTILGEMLLESIKVLKSQGIKYVELSYSNRNTLETMIDIMRKAKIEGITVRFLLSERRDVKAKAYRSNSRAVKELLDKYPEVVGFDVMGFEEEIFPVEYEKTDGCKTIYDRLKYTIENMLLSSRDKPTLRLHSGEIFYNRENSPNNNPFFILEILQKVEKDLQAEGKLKGDLANRLNIRIGHGLHFQETEDYFKLLEHFGVVVEICASSNFALGNVFDLRDIPYKTYAKHHIPFVIGTDGGGFYLTTLKDEAAIAKVFGGGDITSILKEHIVTSSGDEPYFQLTQPEVEIEEPKLSMLDIVKELIKKHSKLPLLNGIRNERDLKKRIKQHFKSNYTLDIEEEHHFPKGMSEIEKVKREYVRLQSYFHDKIINEPYYSLEEQAIILDTFKKIEKAISYNKVLDAAVYIYSLQKLTNCESRIEKTALYMYANGYEVEKVLGIKQKAAQKKSELKDMFQEEYEFKNSLKRKTIYPEVEKILSKKSEIRDLIAKSTNIENTIQEYFNSGKFTLDIPERGYFDLNTRELEKFEIEFKRTKKFCFNKFDNEEFSKEQGEVVEETIYTIEQLIYERNYLEAAAYLVAFQTVLGMKTKLETMYLYMYAERKDIKDYIDLEKFNKKGNSRKRGL